MILPYISVIESRRIIQPLPLLLLLLLLEACPTFLFLMPCPALLFGGTAVHVAGTQPHDISPSDENSFPTLVKIVGAIVA